MQCHRVLIEQNATCCSARVLNATSAVLRSALTVVFGCVRRPHGLVLVFD